MTDYYKTSADFHDAVDRYEAQERAEQAEREYREAEKREADKRETDEDEKCECLQYAGDAIACLIHGLLFRDDDPDGSDTSMATQLDDAGFGSGGVL